MTLDAIDCNDVVASHGGAFGTCSAAAAVAHGSNDPRVHVTSGSVVAVAAVVVWLGEPQDSNRICQSHLRPRHRTRRCERSGRSCRMGNGASHHRS